MTALVSGAHRGLDPAVDRAAEHVSQDLGRPVRVLGRLRQHSDTAVAIVLGELVERGPHLLAATEAGEQRLAGWTEATE